MEERLDSEGPRGFDAYEVTLGDLMRGERATLGKSLLDVQRDLRIKATYLAAIENCDASAFQTPGFIAGYVRSYARYLGLDPEECYNRFCEESGFTGVHAGVGPGRAKAKAAPAPGTKAARVPPVDPLAAPRVPMTPPPPGLLSRISLAGLGSVSILALLLGGLGYAGWLVLQEVQRVQLAPVNHTPGVTAEIATLPAEATDQSDNVVALNPTRPIRAANLDQLYRPRELDAPLMVPRDAPIATIDAGSVGAYADVARNEPAVTVRREEEAPPPKVIEEGPPPVDIVALKPSWVRVYFDDGSVLFERTLNAGESYRLPPGVEGAKLRTGNAGGLYARVGDVTYGPMGRSGSVVKNIPLDRTALAEAFSEAGDALPETLAPPLNLEELLKEGTATALAEEPAAAAD